MGIIDRDKWQEIWSVLKKNKLRTFFTAFGVFWGIFMLVIMMGSGRGLENAVKGDFGDFATNSFFMWTQRTTKPYKGFTQGRWYNFKNDDTEALKRMEGVGIVAPKMQAGGYRSGGNNVIRGERTGAFEIMGDTPEFFLIQPMIIEKGRFINQIDMNEQRKVAVIGQRVYEEMFLKDENPIGEYLKINGVYFRVVGLVKSKNHEHQAEQDNRTIFMPFSTLQKVYNYGDIVGWYSITAAEGFSASDVEREARSLMKQRHSVHPDDDRAVGSWNMEEEFNKMNMLFAGIRGLVWIVGMGTLFAGVIGVSNIMLIVVKERTKEIGIQRAIGATPATVITQIIMESVILTTLAGYTGLVIGVGILEAINYMLISTGAESEMFKNPEIDFKMAMTALGVLIISGAFAGLIPARRAVSIRPIDALRDE